VTTVRAVAPAKINLSLRIRSRRPDGYHELTTVFHAVSLEDTVSISAAVPGSGCTITVTGEGAPTVPLGDDNIVSRAAYVLSRDGGRTECDIDVHIAKSIPVAAGMAGGSADAAAALLGLCRVWDLNLTPAALMPIAAQLGADVPFALMGGTARGTGRGDRLTPVLAEGELHWVIALSDAQLPTPRVYAEWDRLLAEGRVTAAGEDDDLDAPLLRALRLGDPRAIAPQLANDLQPAAVSLHPQLQRVLDTGVELGALAGIVSGSGPTCAFLAEDRETAVALAAELAGAGVARGVRAVSGPVGGAHLIA